MKGFVTLLLTLCFLFTGCTQTAQIALPDPISKPTNTQGAPVQIETTPSMVTQEAAEATLGRELDGDTAPIIAYYTGADDGMFLAVYRALSETVWTDVSQAIQGMKAYLPEGTQGAIFLELSQYTDLFNGWSTDSTGIAVTKEVCGDFNLAYLTIHGHGSTQLLLLFDIKENGTYLPFCAQVITFRNRAWRFERHAGSRWLIHEYDFAYGTGICLTACDWYNIESGRMEICYLSGVDETCMPWCPLGRWMFWGTLSEPSVTEKEDGFTISMEASSILQRLNSDQPEDGEWQAEECSWECAETVKISYNAESGNAYAETGADGWYFHMDDYGGDIEGYCAPFITELSEAAAGEGPGAWWAKWMLSGAGNWEAFFEANGLVYEGEA